MKAAHSRSLLLAWRVAEAEASHLGAAEIKPAHLLIGLAKTVDLDWIEATKSSAIDREEVLEEMLRETRALRNEFESIGIDPKQLRRKLRRLYAEPQDRDKTKKLRRDTQARSAFANAEKLAVMEGGQVYPRHLLKGLALADKDAFKLLLRASGQKAEKAVEAYALWPVGKPTTVIAAKN